MSAIALPDKLTDLDVAGPFADGQVIAFDEGTDRFVALTATTAATPSTLVLRNIDGDAGFGALSAQSISIASSYGIDPAGSLSASTINAGAGQFIVDGDGFVGTPLVTTTTLQVSGVIEAGSGAFTVNGTGDVNAASITASGGNFSGGLDVAQYVACASLATDTATISTTLSAGLISAVTGTFASLEATSFGLSGDFTFAFNNAAITDLINIADFFAVKFDGETEDYYVVQRAPPAAITSAELDASQFAFYLDEATNTLKVKVKYAGGTVKTGSIAVV